jgi:hypothetical protein
MPAGVSAYKALANVTLGSSASSVTFSSINQGFRDLVLVAQVKVTSGDFPLWRLNGDTGSNYNYVEMTGSGSAASSSSGNNTAGITPGGNADTTNNTNYIFNFMDYSVTDKHKTVLLRVNNAATGTGASAQRWANTAAITTILVYPSSTTWAAGTTFALYGVSA